jgi:glutaminyl-peptide cyclotransferase
VSPSAARNMPALPGICTVTALVLGLLCGSGCRREPAVSSIPILDPSLFSGDTALKEVAAFVALGPRVAGTDGARLAALHIKTRLNGLGVDAEIDEFVDATPFGSNRFRNVIGRFPGNSDKILLLAHYDTKGGVGERFVGANDSGSGVGVLLELARLMVADCSQNGLSLSRPSVWMAFLDGEECSVGYGAEDGLHGSRHLARQLVEAGERERVKAVILLDMIGDRDLTVTIPRNGTPELTTLAFSSAEKEGARSSFSLFRGEILDDHQPFLDLGMPAVNLIDFEFGSGPRKNDYWHTEQDTLDKLSATSLATIGRVVARMINGLR